MAEHKFHEIIKPGTNFDFMGFRRKAYTISGAAIVLSLAILIFNHYVRGSMLNYAIDFMGGTQAVVKLDKPKSPAEVRKAMEALGYKQFRVVNADSSDTSYMIRMRSFSTLDDSTLKAIEKAITGTFGDEIGRVRISEAGDRVKIKFIRPKKFSEVLPVEAKLKALGLKAKVQIPSKMETGNESDSKKKEEATAPVKEYTILLPSMGEKLERGLSKHLGVHATVQSLEGVGSQVGEKLRINGILSILYALGFILLYIALRFDLKFAPGAIIALVHDVTITVGVFALFWREFSLDILAALLTIVGYSLNDTIVVYDRIRENIVKMRIRDLARIINVSINETLSRTLLTSLTTFFTVAAIYIVATGVLQDFAFAMGIGIIVGTYSSIFVASPVVIWLHDRIESYKTQQELDSVSVSDVGLPPELREAMEAERAQREGRSSEADDESEDDGYDGDDDSDDDEEGGTIRVVTKKKTSDDDKKSRKRRRRPRGGRGGRRGR